MVGIKIQNVPTLWHASCEVKMHADAKHAGCLVNFGGSFTYCSHRYSLVAIIVGRQALPFERGF